MECQSTVPVEGHAWAMQEVTPVTRLLDLYRNSYGGRDPPAAVVQHCSGAAFSRQLAVLSAQGALLVTVGRPVDCLRQLMIECGGPEAEAVRGYFGLQGPEQATATALVLATSSALVDRQVMYCIQFLPKLGYFQIGLDYYFHHHPILIAVYCHQCFGSA